MTTPHITLNYIQRDLNVNPSIEAIIKSVSEAAGFTQQIRVYVQGHQFFQVADGSYIAYIPVELAQISKLSFDIEQNLIKNGVALTEFEIDFGFHITLVEGLQDPSQFQAEIPPQQLVFDAVSVLDNDNVTDYRFGSGDVKTLTTLAPVVSTTYSEVTASAATVVTVVNPNGSSFNTVVPVVTPEDAAFAQIAPESQIQAGQIVLNQENVRVASSVAQSPNIFKADALTKSAFKAIPFVDGDSFDGLVDVLYIPFNKVDGDRQIFTPDTNYRKEDTIVPGVLDFHGAAFGGLPEDVGKVLKRWQDESGKWARIQLFKDNPKYLEYYNALKQGSLFVSPGAIEGYFRHLPDGQITDWATGEISFVVADGTKRPKNWYAIAKPRSQAILKAVEAEYKPLFDNVFVEDVDKAQATYGGTKRSELKDSDFLFPEDRSFPVVTCVDVGDVIPNMNRSSHSYGEIRDRLVKRAKELGCESSLPKSWQSSVKAGTWVTWGPPKGRMRGILKSYRDDASAIVEVFDYDNQDDYYRTAGFTPVESGSFFDFDDVFKAASELDLTPPKSMRDVAYKALKIRNEKPESQRGGTAMTLARGQDIVKGKELSIESVRRMARFFKRHEASKKAEGGKNWQAWNMLGGDVGCDWVKGIAASLKAKTQKADLFFNGDYNDDEMYQNMGDKVVAQLRGLLKALGFDKDYIDLKLDQLADSTDAQPLTDIAEEVLAETPAEVNAESPSEEAAEQAVEKAATQNSNKAEEAGVPHADLSFTSDPEKVAEAASRTPPATVGISSGMKAEETDMDEKLREENTQLKATIDELTAKIAQGEDDRWFAKQVADGKVEPSERDGVMKAIALNRRADSATKAAGNDSLTALYKQAIEARRPAALQTSSPAVGVAGFNTAESVKDELSEVVKQMLGFTNEGKASVGGIN